MKNKKESEVNQALKSIVDKNELYRMLKGDMSAGNVLEVVQNYLEYSYWCDISPLNGLRKSCPDFIWEYHEFPEETNFGWALLKKLEISDFFWPITTVSLSQWVTARRKGIPGEALGMCGCFDNFIFYDSAGKIKREPPKLEAFLFIAREKGLSLLPEMERQRWQKIK